MILVRPTGLYSSVLPMTPEDDVSVVFTISNTLPPRSPLLFTQIVDGVRRKAKGDRVHDRDLRRMNLGELVFINKSTDKAKISVGNQLFSPGQVFDFEEQSETDPVVLVSPDIETVHNQHYVDEAALGISNDDTNEINENALDAQRKVLDELKVLQNRLEELNTDIVSQQKIINDANRVIDGLDAILANDQDENIEKIKSGVVDKREQAEATLNELLQERNELPDMVAQKQDQLRSLANLIN